MSGFATTEYEIMFWKYFLKIDGPMVFCHEINGTFRELKQEHSPTDWRLSIDSSQRNPHAILLQIGKSDRSLCTLNTLWTGNEDFRF
jgi:hypothetical protein